MAAFDSIAFDADTFDAGASTPTFRLQGTLSPFGAIELNGIAPGIEISGRLGPSGNIYFTRVNTVRIAGEFSLSAPYTQSAWVDGVLGLYSEMVRSTNIQGELTLSGGMNVSVGCLVEMSGLLELSASTQPCWCSHG